MHIPATFYDATGQFESYAIVLGRKGCCKLANGIEQVSDLLIVAFEPLLKFGELGEELLIGGEHFAHAHECANHKDTHLDGSCRIQNVGRHDSAMFGKSKRQITAAAMA